MNILLLECDQLSVMMIINKHCKNTVELCFGHFIFQPIVDYIKTLILLIQWMYNFIVFRTFVWGSFVEVDLKI